MTSVTHIIWNPKDRLEPVVQHCFYTRNEDDKYGQANRQAGKQTGRQAAREIGRQAAREIGGQAGRQAARVFNSLVQTMFPAVLYRSYFQQSCTDAAGSVSYSCVHLSLSYIESCTDPVSYSLVQILFPTVLFLFSTVLYRCCRICFLQFCTSISLLH